MKTAYQANFIQDAEFLPVDQLAERYGIEIDEDGVVWDPIEMKEFESVGLWAAFMTDLEQGDTYLKRSGKHKFDDEDQTKY